MQDCTHTTHGTSMNTGHSKPVLVTIVSNRNEDLNKQVPVLNVPTVTRTGTLPVGIAAGNYLLPF